MKKYEKMAKLDLPEDESRRVSERAGALLESFAALEGIDTEGVAPLVSVLDVQNVLRDDAAVKTVEREALLKNAPEQAGGFFKVPVVIK